MDELINNTVSLFRAVGGASLWRRGLYGQDLEFAYVIAGAFLLGGFLFFAGSVARNPKSAGICGLIGILLVVCSLAGCVGHSLFVPHPQSAPQPPESISEPVGWERLAIWGILLLGGVAFFKVVGIL